MYENELRLLQYYNNAKVFSNNFTQIFRSFSCEEHFELYIIDVHKENPFRYPKHEGIRLCMKTY